MADIGKAYVQIVPSANGIEGSIKSLIGAPADSAGKDGGQKAGSSLVSALKGVIAAAGIGKILKDAFSAGGDLQQSFGGLDTIYGDAAAQAKQFAVEAASAGISANTYAEQAVSFGASLKQAFGGDTTAAMEAANTAIMDMADNSAKMGTDISSIQAAYQGFAKQNYTMLDNLKLGYGGTKEEMERLLAEAEKLPSAMGKSFDINNLGDVYEAIHLIQGELGLTGVAADEAKTTLTGSIGAMKASWQNLLAAMMTGQGMDAALKNLGTSAGDVLKNVAGMASNLVSSLPTVLTDLVTQIGPTIMQSGGDIVSNLFDGIVQNLPTLLATGGEVISNMVNGITQALPNIAGVASDIIQNTADYIRNNLPNILTTGIELLSNLLTGVLNAIPQFIEFVPELFSATLDAIMAVDWADLGKRVIDGIIQGLWNAATALWDAVRSIVSNALHAGQAEAEVGSPSRLFARELGQWIPPGVAEGIDENLTPVERSVRSMIDVAAADYSAYTSSQPLPAARQPQPAQTSAQGGEITIKLVMDASLDSLARALHPRLEVVGNAHGVKIIN